MQCKQQWLTDDAFSLHLSREEVHWAGLRLGSA